MKKLVRPSFLPLLDEIAPCRTNLKPEEDIPNKTEGIIRILNRTDLPKFLSSPST